ncbi:MAG: RNA methyltransferase [Bdellovibrionales bacterium]|nr:RNA methyltransferase [Bdellovibrionales bacterium]
MANEISFKKIQIKTEEEQLNFLYRKLLQWDKKDVAIENITHPDMSTFLDHMAKSFKSIRKELSLLNSSPTPRHLDLLLTKLERILNKETLETEFLVTHEDRTMKLKEFPLVAILDNIRSSYNVGSFFRTADSLGVSEVALCGYTATPEHSKTKKTTMGAEGSVKWLSFSDASKAIQHYKSIGYTIYALETSDQSTSLEKSIFNKPAALVFGNERFGLTPETLHLCDHCISIPQYGIKNSMNVAVAFGITTFTIIQQWLSPSSEKEIL